MAEWLRRWTSNLMGAQRVGSNPVTSHFFSFFFYDDDDGGALRDCSKNSIKGLYSVQH